MAIRACAFTLLSGIATASELSTNETFQFAKRRSMHLAEVSANETFGGAEKPSLLSVLWRRLASAGPVCESETGHKCGSAEKGVCGAGRCCTSHGWCHAIDAGHSCPNEDYNDNAGRACRVCESEAGHKCGSAENSVCGAGRCCTSHGWCHAIDAGHSCPNEDFNDNAGKVCPLMCESETGHKCGPSENSVCATGRCCTSHNWCHAIDSGHSCPNEDYNDNAGEACATPSKEQATERLFEVLDNTTTFDDHVASFGMAQAGVGLACVSLMVAAVATRKVCQRSVEQEEEGLLLE